MAKPRKQTTSPATDLEVACPTCTKMGRLTMVLTDIDKVGNNPLEQALGTLSGLQNHYSFEGIMECSCGKTVISILTVYAYE